MSWLGQITYGNISAIVLLLALLALLILFAVAVVIAALVEKRK